jgi:hypothetical protein
MQNKLRKSLVPTLKGQAWEEKTVIDDNISAASVVVANQNTREDEIDTPRTNIISPDVKSVITILPSAQTSIENAAGGSKIAWTEVIYSAESNSKSHEFDPKSR